MSIDICEEGRRVDSVTIVEFEVCQGKALRCSKGRCGNSVKKRRMDLDEDENTAVSSCDKTLLKETQRTHQNLLKSFP